MAASERRCTITEAAKLLDRSPHTLRSWDRNGSMPAKLRPKRDALGHRYWTPQLIEQIKEWIVKNHFHPGRGIDYDPSPEQLAAHIKKIRSSSSSRAGRNGKHDALKSQVSEAINDLGVDPSKVLAGLPTVAAQHGVPLEEALRLVAEVVDMQ